MRTVNLTKETSLETKRKAAGEALDAWVREIEVVDPDEPDRVVEYASGALAAVGRVSNPPLRRVL